MPYKTTSITLHGTLQGPIWWPVGSIAFKKFKEKFRLAGGHNPWARDWDGMRDALLHITNDGDFQHCKIQSCYLVVTRSNGVTTRQRAKEITHESAVDKDLFVEADEFVYGSEDDE